VSVVLRQTKTEIDNNDAGLIKYHRAIHHRGSITCSTIRPDMIKTSDFWKPARPSIQTLLVQHIELKFYVTILLSWGTPACKRKLSLMQTKFIPEISLKKRKPGGTPTTWFTG
jgi:hypothetical protein